MTCFLILLHFFCLAFFLSTKSECYGNLVEKHTWTHTHSQKTQPKHVWICDTLNIQKFFAIKYINGKSEFYNFLCLPREKISWNFALLLKQETLEILAKQVLLKENGEMPTCFPYGLFQKYLVCFQSRFSCSMFINPSVFSTNIHSSTNFIPIETVPSLFFTSKSIFELRCEILCTFL